MNGSDEARVLREIDAASAYAPVGRITLVVTPAGPNRLAANVSAATPVAIGADRLDVMVVVFERGITTSIRRGENSGRTLEDDFVVRRLTRAFSFKPEAGAS